MSNALSVRRVEFQDLDEHGIPEGESTFGVMASDSHEQGFNNTFPDLESLNKEIDRQGSIILLVDGFDDADPEKIGTGNFYGKNWMHD